MTAINQNANSFLNKIDSLDLTSNQASAVAQTKSEIIDLFSNQGTINEGEGGVEKVEKQIAELEKKIKGLEEEAEKIYDEISVSNDEVNKKSDALAKTTAKMTGAIGDLRENTLDAANLAAREAIRDYKPGGGNTFENLYNNAFRKHLGGLQANQAELQTLYDLYEQQRGGISSIAAEIQTALDKVGGLQSQVKNINGTISLLTRTKNIMANSLVKDAYKNVDTDANVPIYSGKKAEVANSILAQFTSRNIAGKTDASKNATTADKTAVMNKYLDKKEGKFKSGDKYNRESNPELKNLDKLYKGGMLNELKQSGMTNDEIMTFISSNWNVGISKDKNGSWKIPKGHTSGDWVKEPVFNALSKMLENGSASSGTADNVNQNQLKELQEAMNPKKGKDILTQMYEAGFTFKEAMYTLTQAFPDAGIDYDLNSQTSKRNYTIVKDTNASGKLYKGISDKILQYWNVGGTAAKIEYTEEPKKSDRFDPMTFQQGDTTYTFITDRDGDGKFDYTNGTNNELLGSQNGIEELLAYDKDGDGKISGDELKDVLLMANKQDESVANKGDVNKYKNGPDYTNSVDFHVSYTSAADLGIEEIDLTGLAKGAGSGDAINSTTKNYDGTQEAYDDINGSSVINTFNIKMKDGKTIEGKETLNTEGNLETFYGKIAKNSNASTMGIKFDEATVRSELENADGSAKIEGIKDKLKAMKDAHAALDPSLYEDPIITAEEMHELTGLTFLNGMRDAGRVAAEDNSYDEDVAAQESMKAVDNYWEEHIYKKEDADKKKDKDNPNKEK